MSKRRVEIVVLCEDSQYEAFNRLVKLCKTTGLTPCPPGFCNGL